MDLCAATDSVWHWGPQPDGTDACMAEQEAYASCIDSASCEELYDHFNHRADSPCDEVSQARTNCGQANLPEES